MPLPPYVTLNYVEPCSFIVDDGFSINSNFYPESDSNMIDDDDEIDTMIEADSYQSLDHDDFDCCSHFKEANWFSRVFFFWPSAIIMVCHSRISKAISC